MSAIEAAKDAAEDALATACYQGEFHGDGSCECPTDGTRDLIITATLKAALAPLADEAETWAKHCDEQGDLALATDKDKEAARAYQARDTHNSYAKRLRAISEGKS